MPHLSQHSQMVHIYQIVSDLFKFKSRTHVLAQSMYHLKAIPVVKKLTGNFSRCPNTKLVEQTITDEES